MKVEELFNNKRPNNPRVNLNIKSMTQSAGTGMLPFLRSPHQPWKFRPAYVKFEGEFNKAYDPVNEFSNQALYGANNLNGIYSLAGAAPPPKVSPVKGDSKVASGLKIAFYSIPVSMGLFSAGMVYGLRSNRSLLVSLLYGSVAGSVPMGLALYKLKNALK
jgi:hypothetical protein